MLTEARKISALSVGHGSASMRAMPAAIGAGMTVAAAQAVHGAEFDTASALARLTPAERAHAERFHRLADRIPYIAAHALLATMVEAALGQPVPGWRLVAAQAGEKPRLEIDDGRRLYANLSHTRGAVLAGLSSRAEIGVDIEAGQPLPDLDGIAALTMAAGELRALGAQGPAEPLFYRLWTRKEALLKAFGVGLAGAPTTIDVLDAAAPRLPPHLAGPLTLLDLEGAGAPAAICILAARAPALLLVMP